MNSDYLYKFGKYPGNNGLVEDITAAAENLNKKLTNIVLDDLNISDYNKRYFGGHIESLGARRLNLTKYGYVLAWALAHLNKPKEELVFMDYGGGHGMLSLLAKQYGIGTVVHSDIYPVSCDDAKSIGDVLGVTADHYIPGDIDAVIKYFQDNNLNCDSVANYDVIEHIYDIDDFLSKLHLLSSGRMSLFLASAANEQNPRIKNALMTMHKEFECRDRDPKPGRKPTDATRAVVELRREIISDFAPSLSGNEVIKLADLTRGLIEPDIKERVKKYCSTGDFPEAPNHPTNTCDPFTGNWFEHLMDPYELANQLNSTGFEAVVRCGFYDQPKQPLKRSVKVFLNMVVRIMGRHGLYFAPYYALSAKK
jgi:2-polyprenyl-3-methyl-5-hydroxy-6-metoxy-1,4-benzoquinol methylase